MAGQPDRNTAEIYGDDGRYNATARPGVGENVALHGATRDFPPSSIGKLFIT